MRTIEQLTELAIVLSAQGEPMEVTQEEYHLLLESTGSEHIAEFNGATLHVKPARFRLQGE